MDANIKYKSSMFSLLFSDPDLLRELYCALNNVTLPAGVPITINTLENALFMDRVNDISFSVGKDKLVVLIEHQSTINPNMPIRLLIYIARIYEKMIDNASIYGETQVKIARPEFLVLYNGIAPYPDERILKLSDAFEELKDLGLVTPDSPALELVVRVLNINEGRNAQIVERCRKLSEYGAFVAKVREFEKECGSFEEAIRRAIVYCRDHEILKEFLETHGTEVLNMLVDEWNLEKVLEYRRKEALEEGMEKERQTLARNALAEGLSFDLIRKLTGLDMGALQNLQAGLAAT